MPFSFIKNQTIAVTGIGSIGSELCKKIAENGAKRLVLAHLSDKNNNPLAALRCTQRALRGADCEVYVAPRGAMEQPIPLTEEGAPCCMFG